MKIKKTTTALSAILITTLLFTFAPELPANGTVYAAAAIPDGIIRVHLSSLGTPTSVTMAASGKHTIADNKKAISGTFTVSVSGGVIKIKAGETTYTLDKDVQIKAGSGSIKNLIKINGGYSYAGDIRLIVKSGKLKIVNSVDYETYVMGVLPYEVGNSAPAEGQKAQAVAARSFAYYVANSRDRSSQEHDVVNTTASQVYYGYNAKNSNCIDAVNATSRQILNTTHGDNVYTCFSASNGGHTELPKNSGAAAINFEYLPYKDDPNDLKYALGSASYSAQVTIPKTLTLSTLKTSTKQPYAMFRSALKDQGIDTKDLKADVKVKSIKLTSPRYTSPDDHCFTGADIVISVPKTDSSAAISTTLKFEPYVDGNKIKRPFLNSVLNLSNKSKYSLLYVRNDSKSFLLAAIRFGHSAGMSQVGANQIAIDGGTYKDILTFYYMLGSKTKLVTKDWVIDNDLSPAKGVTDDTKVTTPKKITSAKPAAPKAKAKVKAKVVKGKVKVSSGNLNVRKGPGLKYKILFKLKKGKTVTILKKKGSWYKIKYGKKTGYVKATYIKKLK
jgi:stage II sporulation protein D